jgi:SAM-dependent methyltransferase
MSWYKNWFGHPDYLKVYNHRDDIDAVKLIDLIERQIPGLKGLRILDLACGNGRHTLELVKRGYNVTGIDISDQLLNIAREKAANLKKEILFLNADMRYFKFPFKFDVIINLFTSFGYFETDEQNELVIHRISKTLNQNGTFVLDFFNSNHIINNFIPRDEKNEGEIKIIQEREIKDNRIIKHITLIKNGKSEQFSESVRLFTFEEIANMFAGNNLEIVNLFGDYSGNFFQPDSERLIIFAELH